MSRRNRKSSTFGSTQDRNMVYQPLVAPFFNATKYDDDNADYPNKFIGYAIRYASWYPQGSPQGTTYLSSSLDVRSFQNLTDTAMNAVVSSLVNKTYYDPMITLAALRAYFQDISFLLGMEKFARDIMELSRDGRLRNTPAISNGCSQFINGAVVNTHRMLVEFLARTPYPKAWADAHEKSFGVSLTSDRQAVAVRQLVNANFAVNYLGDADDTDVGLSLLTNPSKWLNGVRACLSSISNSATSRRLMNLLDYETISLPQVRDQVSHDPVLLTNYFNLPFMSYHTLTGSLYYPNGATATQFYSYYSQFGVTPECSLISTHFDTTNDLLYQSAIRVSTFDTTVMANSVGVIVDDDGTTVELTSATFQDCMVTLGHVWYSDSMTTGDVPMDYMRFETNHMMMSQAAFEILYNGIIK